MKKFLFMTLTSGFIVACGGEGGEPVAVTSPTPTTPDEYIVHGTVNPNGFTLEQIRADWTDVPLMPLESHPKYHTVKGVDDGGLKNVRDDWEVMNAIASYPDRKEQLLLNNAARLNNEMIDAYEAGDEQAMSRIFEEDSLNVFCYGFYYYKNNRANSMLLRGPAKDTEVRKKHDDESGILLNQINDRTEFYSLVELEQKCPELIK